MFLSLAEEKKQKDNTHTQTHRVRALKKARLEPELQLGEIISVVKIRLVLSNKHVSHKHFNAHDEATTQQSQLHMREQAHQQRAHMHKHFPAVRDTYCVNIWI